VMCCSLSVPTLYFQRTQDCVVSGDNRSSASCQGDELYQIIFVPYMPLMTCSTRSQSNAVWLHWSGL
jgi:hypothetical protein